MPQSILFRQSGWIPVLKIGGLLLLMALANACRPQWAPPARVVDIAAEGDPSQNVTFSLPEGHAGEVYSFRLESLTLPAATLEITSTGPTVEIASDRILALMNRYHLRHLIARGIFSSMESDKQLTKNADLVAFIRQADLDRFDNPFRRMVKAVAAEPDSARQQALADQFLTEYPVAPYVDPDYSDSLDAYVAFYFVQGPDQSAPRLTGDAYSWSADTNITPVLEQLGATTIFAYETTYEASARLDYKLVVNGEFQLDPRNPHQAMGGFGPNSELRMPRYIHPTDIDPAPARNQGTLTPLTVTSNVYRAEREAWVYLPPSYSEVVPPYPVFWFLDGQDFLQLGSTKNVLDNAIAAGLCRPIMAVFIPFVDREREYFAKNIDFRSFLVGELRPQILAEYNASDEPGQNAVGGVSWSAQAALEIATNHPDVFGLIMGMSTAGRPPEWYPDTGRPLVMYFDWGTYEATYNSANMRAYAPYFSGQHRVTERWFYDGHNWANWRGHVGWVAGLFFPQVSPGLDSTK